MKIVLLLVIADDVRIILRHYLFSEKKETIFFCFEILLPLYIDFIDVFCCVDVRKRANVSL